jgi:hypothetical protein
MFFLVLARKTSLCNVSKNVAAEKTATTAGHD